MQLVIPIRTDSPTFDIGRGTSGGINQHTMVSLATQHLRHLHCIASGTSSANGINLKNIHLRNTTFYLVPSVVIYRHLATWPIIAFAYRHANDTFVRHSRHFGHIPLIFPNPPTSHSTLTRYLMAFAPQRQHCYAESKQWKHSPLSQSQEYSDTGTNNPRFWLKMTDGQEAGRATGMIRHAPVHPPPAAV